MLNSQFKPVLTSSAKQTMRAKMSKSLLTLLIYILCIKDDVNALSKKNEVAIEKLEDEVNGINGEFSFQNILQLC